MFSLLRCVIKSESVTNTKEGGGVPRGGVLSELYSHANRLFDGTTEPVSRDQILRRERGQGKTYFPCSADHEQDWQPYPVDPYSVICDDRIYYEYFKVS